VIKALQPVLSEKVTDPAVVMDDVENQAARYLRSLSRMRRLIGILGIALPVLLITIDWRWFDEHPVPRSSLSAYYYSGMRELFVATLAATGIFLISYRVAESNLSNTLTNIAGGCAVLIAWFPTSRPSHSTIPLTALQARLGEQWVTRIHFGASGFFIGLLGVMSLFFGIQEGNDRKGEPGASFLRWYHWGCTTAIAAAGAWILVSKFVLDKPPHRYLLWGEIVSAVAFGASWLMKGFEIDRLFRKPTPTVEDSISRDLLGGTSRERGPEPT
jgi:hypothetical protein